MRKYGYLQTRALVMVLLLRCPWTICIANEGEDNKRVLWSLRLELSPVVCRGMWEDEREASSFTFLLNGTCLELARNKMAF